MEPTNPPELKPCPVCQQPLDVLPNGLAVCQNLADSRTVPDYETWFKGSCILAAEAVHLTVEAWQQINAARTPHPALREPELEAIRLRAEAASKEPWEVCGASEGRCPCGNVFGDGGEAYVCSMTTVDEADPAYTDEQRVKNATFIAHAREDIPALLSALESTRDLLTEVARSGTEFDDIRLDYVTVQIPRETWDAARALGEVEGQQ